MLKFWGKVRLGQKRGSTLGFPTVNVFLKKKIPEGVYLSKTKINAVEHFSLTFIGSNKTFNEIQYKSETFILNFNQNIYNQWVSITLIKKIRNNQKFSSPEELIIRMKQDLEEAKKYFKTYV